MIKLFENDSPFNLITGNHYKVSSFYSIETVPAKKGVTDTVKVLDYLKMQLINLVPVDTHSIQYYSN